MSLPPTAGTVVETSNALLASGVFTVLNQAMPLSPIRMSVAVSSVPPKIWSLPAPPKITSAPAEPAWSITSLPPVDSSSERMMTTIA